jgi:hypothetical protein
VGGGGGEGIEDGGLGVWGQVALGDVGHVL